MQGGAANQEPFSPDGRILSAACGRTLWFWDLQGAGPDNAPQLVLEDHTGAISHIDFAPGGKILASASTDGTVRLWAPHFESSLEEAKVKLGRNLTPSEWAEHFPPTEPYRKTFPDLP